MKKIKNIGVTIEQFGNFLSIELVWASNIFLEGDQNEQHVLGFKVLYQGCAYISQYILEALAASHPCILSLSSTSYLCVLVTYSTSPDLFPHL